MYKASELELNKLLAITLERNASDLHLVVGEPPILRIDSAVTRLEDYQVLSADAVSDLVSVMLTPLQKENLQKNWHLDFSYTYKDNARFRVNVYQAQGVWNIAFR